MTPNSNSNSAVEAAIRELYTQMITGWNAHNGDAMAAPFAEDGEVLGFDGSQMQGRAEIATSLKKIFTDHVTAAYITKVKSVRLLSPEVGVLRAMVGMVPPGQTELNPNVNAHQTIVAVKRAGHWQISLLQNTPAKFHGRPDLSQAFTDELKRLL